MLHSVQHDKNAGFFCRKTKKQYLWLRKSEEMHKATLQSYYNYYPYGMLQPSRIYNENTYDYQTRKNEHPNLSNEYKTNNLYL